MASRRHSYGDDASQFGDLYEGGGRGVAVLIHGGFWRDRYDLTLMEPLALDLVERGFTVWNVEYRRLGSGGGFPATTDDVCAAIDHLAELELDLGSVAAIGHSAGGQLAAWAATREDARVPLTAMVSQAGVLDTRRALELGLSDDVAAAFVDASPIERLPLQCRALLVHGMRDETVPLEISERFAEAAGAELQVFDAGHMAPIDPGHAMWRAVIEWL